MEKLILSFLFSELTGMHFPARFILNNTTISLQQSIIKRTNMTMISAKPDIKHIITDSLFPNHLN